MPGSNSRPNVSEGYEVPLSYRGDRPYNSLFRILGTAFPPCSEFVRHPPGSSNKKRFTVCLRESSFTALQQGDINDLLRVSFPCRSIRVIIKLASDLFSSLKIADKNGVFEPPEQPLERCVYRPLFACYVFRAQRSPCPGSAASISSAVPGPTPTVAQSTPRDSVRPLLALLIHV